MGRATRWLRGLLGMKKDKEKERDDRSLPNSDSNDRKERKRFSFGKSGRGYPGGVAQIPATDSAWHRSYVAETAEKEQNKHAIAVAAATAAAADAAVAAAQAAVAVVRLTSQGRGTLFGGGGKEKSAAIKIQAVFRGYLARKALRALKGLVKLQALVRGYLVRKRAAATLHSMQALIRAQSTVRSQRARRSMKQDNWLHSENRGRKSIERFDETRSELHSKRIYPSFETQTSAFEESPKIVEIDTFKTRSRSRRISTGMSDYGEDMPYQTLSSPLPCPFPPHISMAESRNHQDYQWIFNGDECRFSTAQSTPRFANSIAPATPAKSVCGESFFRPYSNYYPSYMANTQSFKAKLRSHSAPKQRPEPGPRKRLSLNEMMASRASLSGVKMQRSCSHVQEALNF